MKKNKPITYKEYSHAQNELLGRCEVWVNKTCEMIEAMPERTSEQAFIYSQLHSVQSELNLYWKDAQEWIQKYRTSVP